MRTIEQTIRTHLPAQPGWFMHEPVTNGSRLGQREAVDTMRTPIIAWLVCTTVGTDDRDACEYENTSAFPVCGPQLGGRDDDLYALEDPTGRLSEPDGSDLSEATLLEYLNKRLQVQDRILLREQGADLA